MTAPRHIVLVGLMAAGKTPTGRRLAAALGRPLVDCDEQLEARTGRSASELAESDGVDALHRVEAAVLLDALAAPEPTIVTAAASTIEDPRCRVELGHDTFIVWLDADPSVLAHRATDSGHRPAARDVEAQLRAQSARRTPLFASVADVRFDIGETDADGVVRGVLELLDDRRRGG